MSRRSRWSRFRRRWKWLGVALGDVAWALVWVGSWGGFGYFVGGQHTSVGMLVLSNTVLFVWRRHNERKIASLRVHMVKLAKLIQDTNAKSDLVVKRAKDLIDAVERHHEP